MTGGEQNGELETLQEKIEQADAEVEGNKRDLANPHLSRDARKLLLAKYDANHKRVVELRETHHQLTEQKYREDNDIAFADYEKKVIADPLPDHLDPVVLREVNDAYARPTDGMSDGEIIDAMIDDMDRLDDQMVAANKYYRELRAHGGSQKSIEDAARELDVLMTSKMVLEREFGVKRELIESRFAVEREQDRQLAAADYKEFLKQQESMSAEDKAMTVAFVDRMVDLKPGMSNAEILSAMDRGMARIDHTIVEQHRKYQDMRADKTATTQDIQREARDLELLMVYKMVLEEQMAKYTD